MLLKDGSASLPAPALYPPPALDVVRTDQRDAAGPVQLRINAHSSEPLARLRLFADGLLVDDLPLSGKELTRELALPQISNARWLTVQVTDAAGLVSAPQAVRVGPHAPATSRLYGILVGVDNYRDAKLALRFASSDAKRLGRALEANVGHYYGSTETALLLGPDAGRQAILSALERTVAAAAPADTIVFSFAGHGVQDDAGRYYLTPADFDLSRISETGLAWGDVALTLRATRARVIVILDACHAGLSGSEQLGTNDDAAGALILAAHAPMLVLAASKGRQLSYEDARWGGGLFTYALVEVLQRNRAQYDLDHDGVIEASELYRALKAMVVRQSEGRQTPWLARQDLLGDFALF
jgi:hypothetical protein